MGYLYWIRTSKKHKTFFDIKNLSKNHFFRSQSLYKQHFIENQRIIFYEPRYKPPTTRSKNRHTIILTLSTMSQNSAPSSNLRILALSLHQRTT